MGEKIKDSKKVTASFGSNSGVIRDYKLPPTSSSSARTSLLENNGFGRGAKLAFGFGSLFSVCGSIFASFWLFNQPENINGGKESITTSLEGLKTEYTALKSAWEEYKQKYETLINADQGLLKKITELEGTIENLKKSLTSSISATSDKK